MFIPADKDVKEAAARVETILYAKGRNAYSNTGFSDTIPREYLHDLGLLAYAMLARLEAEKEPVLLYPASPEPSSLPEDIRKSLWDLAMGYNALRDEIVRLRDRLEKPNQVLCPICSRPNCDNPGGQH